MATAIQLVNLDKLSCLQTSKSFRYNEAKGIPLTEAISKIQ